MVYGNMFQRKNLDWANSNVPKKKPVWAYSHLKS